MIKFLLENRGVYMTAGLLLTIGCLCFIIMLMIVFFSKDKIKTLENKCISALIIANLIGLLLHIGCFITMTYVGYDTIYNSIVTKLYLLYLLAWALLFTLYIFVITSKKEMNISRYNKLFNTISSIFCVLSIIIFVLPLNYHKDANYIYSYGPSVNILYVLIGGCIFLWLIKLLLNFKQLKHKKYIPIFAFLLIGSLITIIQRINPGLQLMTSMETFIIFLMYFTIENPDIKMINQLELAKSQAERANRAKSDFLSSMSHEIRTPLNAIVGLCNIIKESDNLDEIHEDASDVVNASNTLLEIVNGILDISKIEADKMEIVQVSYNPSQEFKNLVNLTETRIGEKEIELRNDFAIDLPETLYGDKGKLKQIITNLLSNAVKYTEKGYIDFKVTCINEKDISKLTITVSDTGRGIKKEQMANLFTKFNRLDEDKNTTIEGTGLGLAITKSLVEMMGGKIVVDSTYGEGSKFTVFLSQKISNTTIEEEKEEINTFDGKKALVVDDNKLNIKVATKILKEFNLDIDECDSGFECINKIENNNNYDIIFMDIMMPKMSGTEALKKLKQIENFNTPVVALTADAIKGESNKYIEVGFNDYLSKPIDKNELNKVLNKILNNTEAEEQKIEEDPNIHKITPITDEEIEQLNKLVEEQISIKQDEDNSNVKGNIEYLKENDIDVDVSLELLGDIEMYNETLNTFIEENKERIPRIEKNKNEGNMKDYSVDVHALKSDSKYLGFKKLAELSYEHELKSKDNDIEYINKHYEELMNEYNKINDIIKKYL